MSEYYVRTTGSNGAAGTSAGAAWLTVGYAMVHVSAGDTIWVGAGVYRISATIAPSSMASMTYLLADVDGSHTGDAGEVKITAYTTNDTTAVTAMSMFTLVSKNFWTVGGFTIVAGPQSVGTFLMSGTTHDITVQDCTFFGNLSAGSFSHINLESPTFGTATNLTVQRCRFFSVLGPSVYLHILPCSATGADTNLNILIRNCLMFSPGAVSVLITNASTNTYKSGGVTVENIMAIGSGGVAAASATISATYPLKVYNSVFFVTGAAVAGNATVAAIEDYNFAVGGSGMTSVTSGGHSISDGHYDWSFHIGQEWWYGKTARPVGMWPLGSPMYTWGAAGAAVTDDLLGGPRPGSGTGVTKALGPYERGNSWVKETGTVRTGSNAISVTGPGYQDFQLPVNAASTTVTVYLRYDSTYAGTLPSLNVINGGECGVTSAGQVQVGAANAWEAVSLTFTPTSAGIVTIRLLSSDTNGGGHVYADDFAVA